MDVLEGKSGIYILKTFRFRKGKEFTDNPDLSIYGVWEVKMESKIHIRNT